MYFTVGWFILSEFRVIHMLIKQMENVIINPKKRAVVVDQCTRLQVGRERIAVWIKPYSAAIVMA